MNLFWIKSSSVWTKTQSAVLLCVHHQHHEGNDSQERKSRKSSQGQQVQDQATATVNERSADGKSTEHIKTT